MSDACKNGHAFTPQNTYFRKGSGWRQCRACQREAVARYEAKKRATPVNDLYADRHRARFLSLVNRGEECWMWTGTVTSHGYGLFTVEARKVLAHRYSYELHRGPIPTGLQVDHLCHTPRCVNPAHLEAVTPEENIRRRNDHNNYNTQGAAL